MLLMEFDKAGAEWVVVAYLTGDARMIDVVESGKSPHVVTGSLISGAPEDLVKKEDKLVGKRTDPTEIARLREGMKELQSGGLFLPRSMSIRQAGKKSNHGLNYGMRYRRFALENEIEEREAKVMVDKYNNVAYPGIPLWQQSIKDQLKKDRTLTNCFGRKVRLLGEWGDELFNQAYSFIPQSTVVDMVNEAMCHAYDDNTPIFRRADLLTQTHDSVTFQYPTDNWRDMAEFAVQFGLGYLSPEIEYNFRKFKIGTDLKVGIHWGEGSMVEVPLMDSVGDVARELERAWEYLHDQSEAA